MPTPAYINHSTNEAKKVVALVNQIMNAANELSKIELAKQNGNMDFSTVDFSNNIDLAWLDSTKMDNATNNAWKFMDGNTLDFLTMIALVK
jgi:hypothetical protein